MESVLVVEVRFDSPLDRRAGTPLANYPPARCTSGRRRRREAMLPMQRLFAARAGGRHVASVAPRLSRALKSGTWMDRDMKYDT